MSQKIDELQLNIGSDASAAIRQLDELSAALGNAASAARGLASGTSFLLHFGNALSKISNINMTKTIEGLDKLQHMDLSNLKDKTIKLDFVVTGADRVDRLKVATAQASKDIQKSANVIAKGLGQEFNVNTAGVKEFSTIIKTVMKDISNGGNGAAGIEQLRESIERNSRVSKAELTGMAEEYSRFLKYINSIKINPAGMGKDEFEEWKRSGLLGLLKNNGLGLDTLFDFSGDLLSQHSGIIDFFTVPESQQDQFIYLREKILEAKQALNDFGGNADLFERMGEAASETGDRIKQIFEEAVSQRMVEAGDKIPIDLSIDQNRFEKQIQDAITAATNKTYTHTPVKIDVDTKVLRNNIAEALQGIDVGQLPQFADRFKTISDSISQMNQVKLQDTGLKQFTDALRRLSSADMSKFDVSAFDRIVAGVTELSKLDDVSNGLNRFVSSIARLSNAGDNTEKSAEGLKKLTPALKDTVTTFQNLGPVEPSINSFVTAVSNLASAGNRAEKSAQGLANLTEAVKEFLDAMSAAPNINANVAQTIQGLGNLAMAGSKTGRVMSNLSSGGKGGNNFFNMLEKSAGSTANAFKKLLSVSANLGGKGVKSIGSFFGTLGLIPTHAASIDRMAISFGNLFRTVVPFYGLRGIFDWLKEAVTIGSSIVEVENVIDTMFGDLGKDYEDLSGLIYKWADTTIDTFGVSELAARQYAGKIMAMFNSSGFDATEGMRDQAAKMSMNLVQMAGDLASFYDINVDEAMTKIQAGLAGMNRPLRSLGINLSVANLQAFALSKGITQSWQSMDQATQMLLRYEYLVEATQYAQGDFAKTSQTFANQVRLLSLNFQVLSSAIGQGLISAVAPAISWINTLIRRLIQAANAFRTFMFTIFGKAIGAAKGVVNELAGYADDAADSLGGIGDSGGGLGGAAKSAKDLAKQLSVLPFDELNQLAKDTDAAGGGGGGGGGGAGGGGLADLFGDSLLDASELDGSEIADAISEWGQKIKNAFRANDWTELGDVLAEGLNRGTQKLNEFLDWNTWKDKVLGFIHPFQETINSMMDSIDWPLVGETFGKGLNTITYTLDEWFKGFEWKNFGIDLATAMNSLLDEWDAPAFGKMIGDKFMIAWNAFSGWVSTFKFDELGTKIKDVIINSMNTIDWATVGTSTADFLNGISDTLHGIFGDDEVKESIKDAFDTVLTNFFNEFKADELGTSLSEAGSAIIEGLGDALWDHRQDFADALKKLFENLPWEYILAGAGVIFAGSFGTQLLGAGLQAQILKSVLGGGVGGAGAAGVAGATGAAATAGGAATLSVGSLVVGGVALSELLQFGGKKSGAFEAGNTNAGWDMPSWYTGYRQADMSLAQPQTTASSATVSVDAKITPGLKGAIDAVNLLGGSVTILKTVDGKETSKYKSTRLNWNVFDDKFVTMTANGQSTTGFDNTESRYHGVRSETSTKTVNAVTTPQFNTGESRYHGIFDDTARKTMDGLLTAGYNTASSNYRSLVSNDATKRLLGNITNSFWTAKDQINSIPKEKDTTINIKKGWSSAKWWVNASGMISNLLNFGGSIAFNAAGGVFTGATGIEVFGEAGPEAALPLRNKRSMKMVAQAITQSGGMASLDGDRLARQIAGAVISAIGTISDRPIDVNAVLYTEDNEVLARTVVKGMKSMDKRYNPVSQYSYG